MRRMALDLVATLVQVGVVRPRIDAGAQRRHDGLQTQRLRQPAGSVALVGAIHDERYLQVVAPRRLSSRLAGWRELSTAEHRRLAAVLGALAEAGPEEETATASLSTQPERTVPVSGA